MMMAMFRTSLVHKGQYLSDVMVVWSNCHRDVQDPEVTSEI
jgi:hypothetical protein